MNDIQDKLVHLISYAIRGIKPDINQMKTNNWEKLFEYAEDHHVKALVYSVLPKNRDSMDMDDALYERWKRDAVLASIGQIQHIRQVEKVLKRFNESKLPVILLKGLVIRELYPKPELRTMCDADILVRESDLDKAREIMINEGYVEREKSPVHISFINKNHSVVEVHWTIGDYRFFADKHDLEKGMWECAEKVRVGESEALSFSPEDLCLHLCIHMAVHVLTGGFGIRQLCDLVLLVEKKGDLIDWTSFYNKCEKWGIQKFISIVFLLCNHLLHMDIPEEMKNHITFEKGDFESIKALADDILDGGAYGKKDLTGVFANELAYDPERKRAGSSFGVVMRFLKLLFPPIGKLSNRYAYAKKNSIFLPVAWFHHILAGIGHKEYGLKDKARFLKSAVFVSIRRNKLLRKLEL